MGSMMFKERNNIFFVFFATKLIGAKVVELSEESYRRQKAKG
jgi:hypothetical protein